MKPRLRVLDLPHIVSAISRWNISCFYLNHISKYKTGEWKTQERPFLSGKRFCGAFPSTKPCDCNANNNHFISVVKSKLRERNMFKVFVKWSLEWVFVRLEYNLKLRLQLDPCNKNKMQIGGKKPCFEVAWNVKYVALNSSIYEQKR